MAFMFWVGVRVGYVSVVLHLHTAEGALRYEKTVKCLRLVPHHDVE